MKKNILSFILGVVFILLVASTTDQLQIFKPATPTHIYVKTYFKDAFDRGTAEADIKQDIISMSAQGYVLKDIYIVSNSFSFIVVMEKY